MDTVPENNMPEERQYGHLRVLTGGKGPTEPPSTNWLSRLHKGTVFLCKKRNTTTIFLLQYHVLHKSTYSVMLLDNLSSSTTDIYLPVDPIEFCKQYDLHEVLAEGQEEGETDGTVNRSDLPAGLGDVEADQSGQGVVPSEDVPPGEQPK